MQSFEGYGICWASHSAYRIQNCTFWNWWSSSTWFKGHIESQGPTSDERILQGNLLCLNDFGLYVYIYSVCMCVKERGKERACHKFIIICFLLSKLFIVLGEHWACPLTLEQFLLRRYGGFVRNKEAKVAVQSLQSYNVLTGELL